MKANVSVFKIFVICPSPLTFTTTGPSSLGKRVNVLSQPLPGQVADEETLPFKLMYTLMHEEGGLRIFASPDSTHSQWNNTRCAIRRAGLQHTILLSTIMSNCAHGPYKSAQNKQSFDESAAHLSETMEYDKFLELLEGMAFDKGIDPDDSSLPSQPSEIVEQSCIKKLPTFDPCCCN